MLHLEEYQKNFTPETIQILEQIPYDVTRDRLYTTEELLAGYDPEKPETIVQSFSRRVFDYLQQKDNGHPESVEMWARILHDSSITNAMHKMLAGFPQRKVVGIMGGHALSRTDEYYTKVVLTAKKLTEMGWLVTSGGGPGAMEATHLGAWLAGRTQAETDDALNTLAKAPMFTDPGWMETAIEIRRRFPQTSGYRSLAIPTWVYGHEPPMAFATDIAQFISNSLREDALITFSFGGILFLPGSAGTFREIFQEIVQDHYLTWKYPNPMIFVGKDYWSKQVPFYPLIQEMLKKRSLKNLLSALVDDVDDIVDILSDFQNILPLIKWKQDETLYAGAQH